MQLLMPLGHLIWPCKKGETVKVGVLSEGNEKVKDMLNAVKRKDGTEVERLKLKMSQVCV